MRRSLSTLLALGAIVLPTRAAGAQPTLPTWTLREELRLDSETHDFPGISSVAVGPRGLIALYIASDRQVRMFDAAGKALFKFGRAGSGPGEFQQANTLRFTGDSVWLYDFAQRRVTVVGPDGKLVRTQPTPAVEGLGFFAPTYISGRSMTGLGGLRSDAGASAPSVQWLLRVSGDSTLTRLLEWPSILVTVDARTETSGYSQVVPLTVQESRGYSSTGDRIAVGTTIVRAGPTSDVHVRSYRADGTLVFDRRIPLPSRPVTPAMRDSALAVIEKASAFGPELARKARPLIPAMQPLHRGVYQGNDGAVVVRVRLPDADDGYVYLDPQGVPRAWLTLPPRAFIYALDATNVWAAVRDEDDLPSVVRYRIVR